MMRGGRLMVQRARVSYLKKGQKGQRGIHHLTSEGEELIQTLRRNWAKVTRDPVSSLAQ